MARTHAAASLTAQPLGAEGIPAGERDLRNGHNITRVDLGVASTKVSQQIGEGAIHRIVHGQERREPGRRFPDRGGTPAPDASATVRLAGWTPEVARPPAVQWAALVVHSTLAAVGLELIDLPAALLLGPMAAAIVVASADGTVRVPTVPFHVAGLGKSISCQLIWLNKRAVRNL